MSRKRGNAMALYAMLLGLVGVPLLTATLDISRVWMTKARLANAVEAACTAYANSPDYAAYKNDGIVKPDANAFNAASLLFAYNMPSNGSLSGISYRVEDDKESKDSFFRVLIVTCSGEADIRPLTLARLASFGVHKTVTVKSKFASTGNWDHPISPGP